MNKFQSRKYRIALFIILAIILINLGAFIKLDMASFIMIADSLFGLTGIVLGAVAVMYPAANVYESTKRNISDG